MKINWKQIGVVAGAMIAIWGLVTIGYNTSGKAVTITNNANEVPSLKEDFRNFKEEVHVNNKAQQDAMINLSAKMNEIIEIVKEDKRERQWDKFNARKTK